MASMPGLVTKTLTFIDMDAAWSANPATYLNDYANKEFDNLLATAPVKQATKQHVTADWVDPLKDWLGGDAKQVIRRGLYWAMRVALYEDAGGPTRSPARRRCRSVPPGSVPEPRGSRSPRRTARQRPRRTSRGSRS
jgi:hypothetical protein